MREWLQEPLEAEMDELLAEVSHGVTFMNGMRVMERAWKVVAPKSR